MTPDGQPVSLGRTARLRAINLYTDGIPAVSWRNSSSPSPPATLRRWIAPNFHLTIARVARNTLATELIERCLSQIDRFLSLDVSPGQFQGGATEAHLRIVDAIARHDAPAARALMEDHLDCGSDRMKHALLRGGILGVGVK